MRVGDRVGRAAPAVSAIAAMAALAWLLEPNTYPSYDYVFTLASAQDILSGRETGYVVPVYSPVPHPLTLAEALVLVPLGDAAFPLMSAVALLAFGLLCWSLLRIGTAIASWPAGVLAAALVFTSPAIFELATRTYGDVVAASLVCAALSLEAAQPRRGWPVLAVLALAGMVRPEVWLLSGVYWLYLAPKLQWPERFKLAALVASAPAVWVVMDALLTGDPLHSFEVTRTYTEKAGVEISADHVWTAVSSLTGWPVVLGAVAGAAIALSRWRAAAAPPLAVAVLALSTTIAPALLGESPVLRRYLVLPGALIALAFALGCLGWAAARPHRRAWRAVGVAVLLATAVVLVSERPDYWNQHRRAQAGRVELLEHLRDWARAPAQRRFLVDPACAPIRVPGYGYRPYLRYWLDIPPKDVAFFFGDGPPDGGSVLLPTRRDDYQRLMLAHVGRETTELLLTDPDFIRRFSRVASDSRWELYASDRCASTTRSSPSERDTWRSPTAVRLSRSSS